MAQPRGIGNDLLGWGTGVSGDVWHYEWVVLPQMLCCYVSVECKYM